MTGPEIAINAGYAAAFLTAAVALIRLCRRLPAARECVASALAELGPLPGPGLSDRHDDEHDVGPDALRLLQDTDAHLNQLAVLDDGLTGAFGPGAPVPDLTGHPDTGAGWDRLRQVIDDDHTNKGD